MQRNRGARFIATLALIAAAGTFFWLQPVRGREPQTVANTFTAWPPFVAAWRVEREQVPVAMGSVSSSLFGDDPCSVFPAASCYVRLAWGDFAEWSLTASEDRKFDPRDPRQLTVGPLQYALNGGVVIRVLDHDRLPRLHVCHRLQRRLRAGEDVRITSLEQPDLDGTALLLQHEHETGLCSAEAGIPLAQSRPGHLWKQVAVELRPPTRAEIGAGLVQVTSSGPICGSTAPLLPSARAWLSDIVGAAGLEFDTSGAYLTLTVPDTTRRPAHVWTTEQAAVPPVARQRLLAPELVSTEMLQPAVVSVPIGGVRVWLSFVSEPDRPFTVLEHDLFVLGEVAKRLSRSAHKDMPYRGPRHMDDSCR